MDRFMKALKDSKYIITFCIFLIGTAFTIDARYTLAKEFEQYKNEQEYKGAKAERRELRQEVSGYQIDLRDFGFLSPQALEGFEEAKDDLKDVRIKIKAYEEAKKGE